MLKIKAWKKIIEDSQDWGCEVLQKMSGSAHEFQIVTLLLIHFSAVQLVVKKAERNSLFLASRLVGQWSCFGGCSSEKQKGLSLMLWRSERRGEKVPANWHGKWSKIRSTLLNILTKKPIMLTNYWEEGLLFAVYLRKLLLSRN